MNRVSGNDTYWINPPLCHPRIYFHRGRYSYTFAIRLRPRRIILSLSYSFSRRFQSPLSRLPSGLSCLEKSRPRVPRRDRSRGPVAWEQMLRRFASLHYTVKTDGTRHLIPSRNVLNDFSWDSRGPASRAENDTFARGPQKKIRLIPAHWPCEIDDDALAGVIHPHKMP